MIRLLHALAALVWLLPLATNAATGEKVVAGLSQNRISITANFVGSEILIFGAVKREEPVPAGRLDVVVTVQGPSAPVTVRRKARTYGIWTNQDQVTVDLWESYLEPA